MNLEEKVAQLTVIRMDMLMGKGRKPSLSLMKRHLRSGIGQISLSAGATELPPEKVDDNVNIIQRYLMEEAMRTKILPLPYGRNHDILGEKMTKEGKIKETSD